MAVYPEVQRSAYQEVEKVVGTQRLPGFADRSSLLYLDAILHETTRYYPVVALGPHST